MNRIFFSVLAACTCGRELWAKSGPIVDEDRGFRRWLFLVHPARIRQNSGRDQNGGGYCGGTEPNPTYKLVTSEKTKYRESIEVTYDPAKISFEQLLDIYWRQIDPTQSDGQFTDIGPSYRAAIFYGNARKRKLRGFKGKLTRSGKFKKPIVTEILPAMKFWPAEDYHQKYTSRTRSVSKLSKKDPARVIQKRQVGRRTIDCAA